jgi:hypothetical protein
MCYLGGAAILARIGQIRECRNCRIVDPAATFAD